MAEASNNVKITIDGKELVVPKGTNLIEAARMVGVEIPHYCYHPHLSIAGNCRMCQVHVEGSPKLTIACNTGATEGMVVKTQQSSDEVSNAQRATLEFLLINHPLDCTVCDQAGHCKLQDYYYEYNGKPSRFVEEKVHKVKAEPLGPEIVYDGERCILCTRCVRFCEEVPGTTELGVFNRGDHSVIGIQPGHELINPLSGTVVDLCPVGALTHRRWRFNTRIWYTNSADSICPGCSTGCNAKVYSRDGEIVQVKARLNSAVNKEWMCDEGRYGFSRFQPSRRLETPLLLQKGVHQVADFQAACKEASRLASANPGEGGTAAVFLSPFLTTEEIWLSLEFARQVMNVTLASGQVAMQLKQRKLTDAEKLLVSPDYAPNARAAGLLGLGSTDENWRSALERGYDELLKRVRNGGIKRLLLVGDFSVIIDDVDEGIRDAIARCDVSVALTPRGVTPTNGAGHIDPLQVCKVLFPTRTVNEKSGVFVNRDLQIQRLKQHLDSPLNTLPEWMVLNGIAKAAGKPLLESSVVDDRALFRELAKRVPHFSNLTLAKIGVQGVVHDSGA